MNSGIKLSRVQIVDFLVIPLLIFIICFLVFLTSGLLTSGFRLFINDYFLITMHHDVKEQGLFSVIKHWLLLDHNLGRFQPFYYIQTIILTIFLGTNSTLWFGYACLLTSLMAYFLFLFARLLEMPVLIALIFPGLALIGPQAIIWAQPSQPQLVGTFLLSASLLFAGIAAKVEHRKTVFDVIFICFVLLMSLSKESFIIFIPALVFIELWLYQRFKQVSLRQAVIQNRLVVAVLFCIAFLEIVYIIFGIGIRGMGHAGLDENTFKVSKILSASISLLQSSHFELFALSIILALIVIPWRKLPFKDLIKNLVPIFVIFLLVVIPQIFLYTKSGFYGAYFIPATVGTALLISYTLSLLRNYSGFLSKIVLGVAVFIICTEITTTWNSYSQMAQDSKSMNDLLRAIHSCTPNNEPVLIVVNPRVRFEASVAVKTVLNSSFQRSNLLVATYGLEKTDFFSDIFRDSEKAWAFLDPQSISKFYENKTIIDFPNKSEIKAVVVFDNLDEDFFKTSSDWFRLENYERVNFPSSFASSKLYCKK